MAISYEWNVNTVDVYPTDEDHTNVIYNVHWRINATDTGVDRRGNPYPARDKGGGSGGPPGTPDFTDFDSVTAAQVQGWVEGAMGEEEVQSLKDSLDAKIADEINPTSETKQLVA